MAIPAAALAAPCPAGPEPRISVATQHDQPPVIDTLTVAELVPLSPASASRSIHSRPVGLSVSQLTLGYDTVLQTLPLPDGSVCGSIVSITATLGFHGTRVYVAREVAGDPCLRAEVLGHENRHVATDQAILDDWAPELRRRFAMAAERLRRTAARSAAAVNSRFKSELAAVQANLLSAMGEDLTHRQARVDSPAEYARVAATCGGRMSQMIGRPG